MPSDKQAEGGAMLSTLFLQRIGGTPNLIKRSTGSE